MASTYMARASKNKSRALDVIETPDLIDEITRERERYRGDFEAFCGEKLRIVNKAGSGNKDMLIPFRFNQCQ